jgi:signal peptidase I
VTAGATPAAAAALAAGKPGSATAGGSLRLGGVLRWAVVAALLALLLRMFVVQSFVIPSSSMDPTLRVGDRVIVSRWHHDVRRGDVVVFDGTGVFTADNPPARNVLVATGRGLGSLLGLPIGRRDYVKRVIGLPDDHVVCCDVDGRLTVNGVAARETYLPAGTAPSLTRFDVIVPADGLWVMGDNRGDSADSRAHLGDPGGGMVPVGNVVGPVLATWWPLAQARRVDAVDPSGAGSR